MRPELWGCRAAPCAGGLQLGHQQCCCLGVRVGFYKAVLQAQAGSLGDSGFKYWGDEQPRQSKGLRARGECGREGQRSNYISKTQEDGNMRTSGG